MSATFLDSAFPPQKRPQSWGPPTADLDSTTDLHEDPTTDLAPGTEDVAPPAAMHTADTAGPPASGTPAFESTPEELQIVTMLRKVEPTRPPALAPGAILCDRYLLEQVIGCGGTAVVYRARDMHSSTGAAPNMQVAIKLPRPELADRTRARVRLEHEFQHARALSHPNIVRVFDLHADAQHCFMTMELIEGKLLASMLRDWTMLPAALAHKILRSCAQALTHAHSRNVVHGDFKPGNVFVMPNNSVKVVDFGAAAAPFADSSRIPAGTPAYASPEVLNGATPEQSDDVFSFACVAYELLTGQHPFERRSSLQARDEGKIPLRAWNLSASQWLALLSALSWQREQRPGDIEGLLNALEPEPPPLADLSGDVPTAEMALAELPADLMPPQRSWGFFVFVACALAVTFIASQRNVGPDSTRATVAGAKAAAGPTGLTAKAAAVTGVTKGDDRGEGAPPLASAAVEKDPPETTATLAPAPAAVIPIATAAAHTTPRTVLSEISFESRSIVTSESSVAAVFLIKRSQPLSGRVRIQWSAISGTADAGIDFASSAAGSVEFADGQAQRAIYVPLRNDLIKEGDEAFTVRLQSPQQARLGTISRAEATIRDDD